MSGYPPDGGPPSGGLPPGGAPPGYPVSDQPSPYAGQPQPRLVPVQLPNRIPLVTYTILGITVLIYIAQYLTGAMGNDLPAQWGEKVNSLIIQGQFWRLITPVLLHGSPVHIFFNMYALFAIGPGLEQHYGHGRYLGLYLLAGFAGNVFSFLFSPYPSLGASTAIFGLLGAEAVFLYQNQKLFGQRARQALTQVIILAVINLIIGLSPGIDNWGHMGGLIAGVVFSWFAGPVLQVVGAPPALSVEDQRTSLNALTTGALVFLLFAALAAYRIFFA